MSITRTLTRLTSLSQADTELNLVQVSGEEILTGGVNSPSERKKIYIEFEVDTNPEPTEQLDLAGAQLWVSWALFFPTGGVYAAPDGVPATGFSLNIPASAYEAGTDAIEMPFYSQDNFHPNALKNIRCWFYFLTDTTFALELEYYITYDEDGYMNGETKSNLWRFFSERYSENNTDMIFGSAYDESKDLRLYTYFRQVDVPEPDTFEGPIIETQEHILWQGQLSRIDSVTEFLDQDDEDIVQLNTVIDTPVTCRIYTAENTIDKFYAKLVRIQDDPSMDFIENYDLQENLIDAANFTYNAFKGPFSVTRFDSGGYYELGFDIDKDYVVAGTQYRIMIVGYDQGTAYVGAFNRSGTSAPITTTNIVPYCNSDCSDYDYAISAGLDFTATLSDIDNEYTGNYLTCAIEERIRAKLIVDYSDDRWKMNLDCRVDQNLPEVAVNSNDLRVYLKGVTLELYEEYTDANLGGTVRNVFEQKTLNKTGVNTYTANGINFSFDLVNETLTMYYDFRNRNENNIPCLYSFLNDVPYLPVQGVQYWGGKLIYIKWTLTFYYTGNNFPNPFTDNISIIQKMIVRDYSNDVTFLRVSGGDIFCPEETLCYLAKIVEANPETYKLINTIELSDGNGGGTGTPEESEDFVPDLLAQQTSAKFSSQDDDYTGGDAQFCIDGEDLILNQTYKISAMAKKQL